MLLLSIEEWCDIDVSGCFHLSVFLSVCQFYEKLMRIQEFSWIAIKQYGVHLQIPFNFVCSDFSRYINIEGPGHIRNTSQMDSII